MAAGLEEAWVSSLSTLCSWALGGGCHLVQTEGNGGAKYFRYAVFNTTWAKKRKLTLMWDLGASGEVGQGQDLLV